MNVRSIRFRIVAAFVLALVSLISAQAFLIWQNQAVGRSLTLITDGYLPLSKLTAQLERDRQRVDNDVRRLLARTPGPGRRVVSPTDVYSEKVSENLAIARIHARSAARLTRTPEERAVFHKLDNQLERIDVLFDAYQRGAQELAALVEVGDPDPVTTRGKQLTGTGNELRDEMDKVQRLLDARIADLTRATEQAQVRANAVAGGLTLLALVFSMLLIAAILIALAPLGRLTQQVQRIAGGDYTGRAEVVGQHEIAVLADEFNKMVQALQLRDRTLVERAEELNRLSLYLGSVLDSLQEGLFVVEAGNVTLANPAAGRRWGAHTHGPPPDALAEVLSQPGRHEVQGPDRTLHELRVTPFGDDGVVVVATDVTEQTRAKQALARSERLALVGQMLAQITHEVRNPLNSLSLNADLLTDELGQLDPDRKTEAWDLQEMIAGEIERLTQLTGHYLQLARRPPAELVPNDVSEVVADVARLLEPEIEQHGAVMQLHTVNIGPQLVDGNQLRQALLNVVRNAVEAGGRHLELSVVADAHELRLRLVDDGPGMSDEEIARATDPFFTTKASGTGLGLAITRQILEDHDGSLVVDSATNQGTTVTLVLPNRPTTLDDARTA